MCINWLWTGQRYLKVDIKANKYKKLSKVSSKVSSLFTSVLLYFTIDVILRKIYRGKEIITNTTLNELKNCYYFAQKMYIFYLMDNFIYKKICIAIGSPLRPTAELERSLLSKLSSYMTSWKRCVDDTITYVKTDAINHV